MLDTSLLRRIRRVYIDELRATIAANPGCHVEPAYRESNGEVVVDGRLRLPCRSDAITVRRRTPHESLMVDSPRRIAFSARKFRVAGMRVIACPFVWDYARFELDHAPRRDWRPLREWFMRWFDADDRNRAGRDGLYGVVHYLSDPGRRRGGSTITVDFGSAPVRAFGELLQALAQVGVTRVSIG